MLRAVSLLVCIDVGMLERSPLACSPDVLLEQLKAGIAKARVAINTVSFFLFFMDTLPRVTVD